MVVFGFRGRRTRAGAERVRLSTAMGSNSRCERIQPKIMWISVGLASNHPAYSLPLGSSGTF